MKKTLLVLALTGTFATVAQAQSSVTLYGLIDTSIAYTNNQRTAGTAAAPTAGHSNVALLSGGVNGSRWGLRGAEDLGGGMKAIFVLENGFSIANGTLLQNGRDFGRQAYVGLTGKQWGKVTAGRQYDSVVDYLAPLSLIGTAYGGVMFAHPFDNDNLIHTFRINNSVKFGSANYNGLTFGGLYGFSNQAGGFGNNRAYSAGIAYNWGPLNVGAGYLQLNNPTNAAATVAGTNVNGAVTSDSNFNASRRRIWGAGANYAFGAAKVGVVWTQTHLDNVSSGSIPGTLALPATPGASLRFNNYEANARYSLTPALTLSGSYTYTEGTFNGTGTGGNSVHPKWHQINLMSDYALSKRTDVYIEGLYQRVSGAGGTPFEGAEINGMAQSANNKQVVAAVGVRHRF